MTAQTPEVKNVLKAYVFVARHGQGSVDTVGSIASNVEDALANLRRRYTDFPHPEEITLFNTGLAVMQPAMIEWWQGTKRVEEKGFYAFLKGIFFCKCASHQLATNCAKRETRTGWEAIIYNHNHGVRPL